ncbi:phage tail tape measure protein [Streptomyces bauhiniae]|uniref:phage tail tape measure protein n=1 Tax=Streptomyces bauhiniae TaxID=2340725 RepID=UPI00331C0757
MSGGGGGGGLLPPVVVRMLGDITQLRATMREARAQVNGTAAGMRQAGATAYAGVARMGRSVTMIGAGAAVASMKMAGDFESGTMVLHTAAGETLSNLKTVRAGILSIARNTGNDWHGLTEGMYQIEKAGIRGADGLKVLKAAAQGAREENASLESVTNAMTSVMASYHLKAKDSVQVMNAMKTAAGEGKMTMEEFASSLSTVLPIASANKISFSEVSGALATLTQHGTSAREGTQELASTIRSLASPNNVAVQEMQRLGLSSTDVAMKLKDVDQGGRGLSGTFDLLSRTVLGKMGPSGTVLLSAFNKTKQAAHDANEMIKAMPKSIQGLAKSYGSGKVTMADWRKELKGLPPEQANLLSQYATLRNKTNGFSAELKRGGPAAQTYTEAMKKMLGGAIGLNTALQLTGENTDAYNERVHKIRESYQHATKDVEGWKETQQTFNVRLAQAKQYVMTAAVVIGTKLIPVVSKVIGFLQEHKTVAKALAGVIAGVLLLSVVAFATKTVTAALGPLRVFGKLGTAGWNMGRRVAQGFRSAQAAESAFSGRAGTFGGALRKAWDGSVSGSKAAIRGIGNFGKRLGSLGAKGARASWDGLAAGARGAGRGMKAAWDASVRGSQAAARGVATFGRRMGSLAARGGAAAWQGITRGVSAAGRAMALAGRAALTLGRRMAVATLAAARSAGVWALQKIRLIAAAIAEKAAAVGQWLLNAAMSANPIMLVVLAIAALVAGLVWAYNRVGWFRAFVDGAFHAIGAAVGWLVGWVRSHWPLLLAILTGPIGIAVLLISRYWKKISSGFTSAYHATVNAGRSLGRWVAGLPGRILGYLSSLGGKLSTNASSAWTRFRTATISKAMSAVAWVRGLPARARNALGSLGSYLYSSGRSLLQGFVNGIKSMLNAPANAVRGALSKARALLPFSPAKEGPFSGRGWTLHSGRALMDGLSQGIHAGSPGAVAAMRGAAQATARSFASTLGIQSPSKVFRSLGIYINEGLVEGLTGSIAKVKAATKRIETLLIQTRNRLNDQRGSSKTRAGRATNAWVAQKLRALKSVERYVHREDAVMRSLAAKRDATAKKLKDAQKKLADLQKSWTSKRDEVANSIMGGMSVVTESPDEGRKVNSFDVVQKMRDQAQKVAEFTRNLAALKKKGLSAGLIDQIAAAGVEGGGDTARALAAASKGQIKEVNSLQASMKSQAKATGTIVADAMYGAGIKAAQGLVKGLQKQEKAIQKQMVRIAKAMAHAIKAALRIKSPSRVFEEIGQYIPKGLAVGIDSSTREAVTSVRTMSGRVSAASSISTRVVGGARSATLRVPQQRTAAMRQEIHHHVHVTVEGSVVSERKLVKTIERGFLQQGARNSTTYQEYKR